MMLTYFCAVLNYVSFSFLTVMNVLDLILICRYFCLDSVEILEQLSVMVSVIILEYCSHNAWLS